MARRQLSGRAFLLASLVLAAGLGYYLDAPDSGPRWKLRTNFVLLLPSASAAAAKE